MTKNVWRRADRVENSPPWMTVADVEARVENIRMATKPDSASRRSMKAALYRDLVRAVAQYRCNDNVRAARIAIALEADN